ncbi:MAG: hypothetical protein Q7N50_09595 [Armatimonadota bacterium]|nr:hypothetical protein [Armatimonadota bacterium]
MEAMITILAFEARRAFRRRLSLLAPIIPILLIIWGLVGKWLGHPLPGSMAALIMFKASLIIFIQAGLSDREGRWALAFITAPRSRSFRISRRVLLLAIPFAFQAAIFITLTGLLKL